MQLPHDKSLDPNWEVGRELIDGVIALLQNHTDDAEKHLVSAKQKWDVVFLKNNKGTSYKPYWPYWQMMMARLRVAQDRPDDAIALYEQMVKPPNPWSEFESRRWVYEGRAALAELVARKGDLARADKLLAENHRWNPSWAPSRPAELAVAEMHRERVQAASR